MEILDPKYEKADLQAVSQTATIYQKQRDLPYLNHFLDMKIYLMAHLELTWNGPEVEIKLRKGAIPHFDMETN
jgi:hypothetical protein